MKPHQPSLFNKVAKSLAGPLSLLVANRATASWSRLAETYWCVLLGKGAGTGWALEAEIRAARSVIATTHPVILDVGANTGQWSEQLHRLFPDGRFFLFEPQPTCQDAIRNRNIPGAVLIPEAVSDQAFETVTLHTTGATSGIASLHQRRDTCFDELQFHTLSVPTTTIDRVVQQHGLEVVDLMKMDIEGHELHALRGAEDSLRRGCIRALTFEFGSSNINSRSYFRDFWELLTPLGYRISRILPSGRTLPIREYYEDCEYFRGVTNYLAERVEWTRPR